MIALHEPADHRGRALPGLAGRGVMAVLKKASDVRPSWTTFATPAVRPETSFPDSSTIWISDRHFRAQRSPVRGRYLRQQKFGAQCAVPDCPDVAKPLSVSRPWRLLRPRLILEARYVRPKMSVVGSAVVIPRGRRAVFPSPAPVVHVHMLCPPPTDWPRACRDISSAASKGHTEHHPTYAHVAHGNSRGSGRLRSALSWMPGNGEPVAA